jgi:hypothetical protein
MSQQKFEVRLTEKESANYFSNAAAMYVLGVGFAYFALRAQSPFMTGVCFWFSVFLLCDCFRLARVCARLDRSGNLLLSADESGFTHYVSWLEPEHRGWKEITGLRTFKAPNAETLYFQAKPRTNQLFRFAFFGSPKFDLPLSCVPGGKQTLLDALSRYPEAKHLVPERAALEEAPAKAA